MMMRQSKSIRVLVVGCLFLAGLFAALFLLRQDTGTTRDTPTLTPAADKAKADVAISFNRDIRPILSDKCFACHGPDAAVAEGAGGFRLDVFEEATKPATSGDTPIVLGDAEASSIIARIKHTNPKLVMPPPSTHTTVNDEELALLTRWIDEGAEYEGHWAYQTPTKPAIPELPEDYERWAKNNIDKFIAYRLKNAGLSPSKEADKATLIRRVSLDLTGLPPTPEEIDAFVADESDDAYEKLVDRLLASPHFGERLALIWLDAARYGDTNGFHHDNIRNAWPWRQWVIEAFNSNMPYDQFVIEQLAGDLLPNATQEQILASGFCRMHNINDEGGAIDAEFLVEAHADRIETIATVFMAQTFNCARCHDHKYDPTTQSDYYSLVAYFNSVQGERGYYRSSLTASKAYPPFMKWRNKQLLARTEPLEAELAAAKAEQGKLQSAIKAEVGQWHTELRSKTGIQWVQAKLTNAASSDAKSKVTLQPDGSALLSGKNPPKQEDITLTLRTDETGLRLLRLDCLKDKSFAKNGLGRSSKGNAVLTHVSVRAVSVADPNKTQDVELSWAWADKEQTNADHDLLNVLRDDPTGWAVGAHLDDDPRIAMFVADKPFGFAGGTELRVTLHHRSPYDQHTLGRVRVDVAKANDTLPKRFPVISSDWFQIGPFPSKHMKEAIETRFGPEDATLISKSAPPIQGKIWAHAGKYTDGVAHSLQGDKRAFYFGRSIFTPVPRKLDLHLSSDDALQVYLNGKEVYAHKAGRRLDPEAADKITVTLGAGENLLVLKNSNGSGPGGFYYRPEQTEDKTDALQPLALIEAENRPDHLKQAYYDGWVEAHSPTAGRINAKIAKLEAELKEIDKQAVPVLIMKESAEPKPAYILARGAYDKPIKTRIDENGAEVAVEPQKRKPPSMVDLPMPKGAPNNRLGFAKWLTQPEHPLTARVHVNRVWLMLFGTGIVKSVEDFGSQADWPSHPALLDHLAIEFAETGWDQKALLKLIVTSATYRQIAVTNRASVGIDPDNRLLSYFPRRRLTGEFVRDQALYVSGLLNKEIGGPSVKPYQPDGLWREVSIGAKTNTGVFKRDKGQALYRRSMYTFWKRTSPPAQMQIFNAPTREFCTVKRDTTNTPLQVLTLWNDEQFLEAARVLAQRTLTESDNDNKRLELIFRRCTGDIPSEKALAVLKETLGYYRQRYADSPEDAKALLEQGEYPLPKAHDPVELASWMMIASTVLSLDETIVRD